MKKNKFILASHNKNKLLEIQNILKDFDIEIVSLSDIGYFNDILENGNSFKENAYIKAKTIYDLYHIPVISDDSGLCVDALNGRPGIYSARYSGGNDVDNNLKLLDELKDFNDIKNRSAHYTCLVCLYLSENNQEYFEGRLDGYIGFDMQGKGGFGYDPLFTVNGCTLANMSMEEKNKISHRADAFNKLKCYLSLNIY